MKLINLYIANLQPREILHLHSTNPSIHLHLSSCTIMMLLRSPGTLSRRATSRHHHHAHPHRHILYFANQRSFLISVFAGTRDLSGPRTGSLGRDLDLDLEPRTRASQLPPLLDPLLPPDDEDTVYDSRGQRISARRRLGEDFADDVASTTRRFRARIAAMNIEDELDAATTASQSRRSAADLLENAVAGRKGARAAIEDIESSFKRRSRLFDEVERADEDKPPLTRWSKLMNDDEDAALSSAAAGRAKQTKARLHDLESEMEELAERQAKRERRAAALRALVNETAAASDADVFQQQAVSKKLRSSERVEKHVTF